MTKPVCKTAMLVLSVRGMSGYTAIERTLNETNTKASHISHGYSLKGTLSNSLLHGNHTLYIATASRCQELR